MILPAGLHHGVPADAYHADCAAAPSLSSTLARLLVSRSPLHAWTASPRLNPGWQPKDTRAFDLGRAAHRAALGVGASYVEIPEEHLSADGGLRSKDARAWAAEVRAEGKTPLKAGDLEAMEAAAARVRALLVEAGLPLPRGEEDAEVVALAERDGVWIRAMVDHAPRRAGYLLDLKTTEDASPEACRRAVARYGYDQQAAHYLDAWEAATGQRRRFVFAFVEKAPPFEVALVELRDEPGAVGDWMADARQMAAFARRLWGECLAADDWPGYPPQLARLDAPAFHRARWEGLGTDEMTDAAEASPSAAAREAAYAAQRP